MFSRFRTSSRPAAQFCCVLAGAVLCPAVHRHPPGADDATKVRQKNQIADDVQNICLTPDQLTLLYSCVV